MSDLAATNCGCGDERCGRNNNCGCGNGNSLFGDNSCNCILWIICLMCLCGNNGCGKDVYKRQAAIPASDTILKSMMELVFLTCVPPQSSFEKSPMDTTRTF